MDDEEQVLERVEDQVENSEVGSDNEMAGEQDEDGEDLFENEDRDYREMPELDRYEDDGLDDEVPEDLSYEGDLEARRAAEDDLNRRDRQQGRRRGLPGALAGDEEEEEEEDKRRIRRRRIEAAQAGDLGNMEAPSAGEGELGVRLEDLKGNTIDHLATDVVVNEVKRRFIKFLTTYKNEDGEEIYHKQIESMGAMNAQSLYVSFMHISSEQKCLSIWVADAPSQMLEVLHEAARDAVVQHFNEYESFHPEVYVRLTDMPLMDNIRDLRQHHLNSLVHTTGVVTRRSNVFPQLRLVKYDCARCGETMGPFAQNGGAEIKPTNCPSCSSKGPFTINTTETVYRNYQKLTVQESPGTVPAGRLPRQKEVILLNDLIDCARPGDEVDVIGLYTHSYDIGLNIKNSFPVFSTFIEANCVQRREDTYALSRITMEDQAMIQRLAADPNIGNRIVDSIAPAIYGHRNIKRAIALSMFGGVEKHPSPAHRIRGDINVLLMGDPGTAKSQFLKYIEKTANRCVYTTGKGASAVGLTAAVHKDPITREWTLEGGALVLADKGVCLIDEFDKMNDQDRVSIHEAMEQQSISISKAGIVTQLQARCAVFAAANPIGGRYDPSRTFAENVNLSDPILSRFDVLCVVRDQADPVQDQLLASFVVDSHMKSHPEDQAQEAEEEGHETQPEDVLKGGRLPQELLRKYITYAKQSHTPQWQEVNYNKVVQVYADLRERGQRTQGMPVAVRHLESMIRMSEAHARMHLRDWITDYDVDVAITMMVDSFISTQKFSAHKELKRAFRKYLVGAQDLHPLLLKGLQDILRDELHYRQLTGVDTRSEFKIPTRSMEEKAREFGVTVPDLEGFYKSTLFQEAGFQLDHSSFVITHAG